jgi:hypothetical protein
MACPQRPRNTRSSSVRPVTNCFKAAVVDAHSGHKRILFPFPCSCTNDWDFSCGPCNRKSLIVSWAASSARAPVLYRNNKRAWSLDPSRLPQSGAASSASISSFSKYPTGLCVDFLNGMFRSCAHQDRCSGLPSPMNVASERTAAKRWLPHRDRGSCEGARRN